MWPIQHITAIFRRKSVGTDEHHESATPTLNQGHRNKSGDTDQEAQEQLLPPQNDSMLYPRLTSSGPYPEPPPWTARSTHQHQDTNTFVPQFTLQLWDEWRYFMLM